MVNDISIAGGIILVFVALGILLPYVNAEFDEAETIVDTDGLIDEVGDESRNVSAISAFSVILSVFTMFFWSFGQLPFFMDILFIPLRIVLAFILARNIWIGGGG